MKKLVLASQSKRRCDLLRNAGYTFDVIVPEIDESLVLKENLPPDETAVKLAVKKTSFIVETVEKGAVVIAADTIVFHNGKILGKPQNTADAYRTLKQLSGDKHFVYTAFAIIEKGGESKTCAIFDKSAVYMANLDDNDIHAYIATGQPMDKAGSYGIQGLGGLFIEKIEGDFFAIEGLPIHKVYMQLKKFGIAPAFSNAEYI